MKLGPTTSQTTACRQPAFEGQVINTIDLVDLDPPATDLIDQPDENFDLAELLGINNLPGVEISTPFELCLRPFLEELGWNGEDRHLIEAIPHLEPIDDIETFCAVVGRLG